MQICKVTYDKFRRNIITHQVDATLQLVNQHTTKSIGSAKMNPVICAISVPVVNVVTIPTLDNGGIAPLPQGWLKIWCNLPE